MTEKKFKGFKLKWRVFAFLLGFCAILLAVLWLFQTVFLDDMYKFVRRRELNRVIEEVKSQIESPDLNPSRLNYYLDYIEAEYDIMVRETINFVMPHYNETFPPYGFYPWWQEAQIQTNPDEREYLTEERVFYFYDGGEVSLTFHAAISPVDATVSTLRTQLYVITAFMLIFSVILAVVISARVSQPIEEINKSALKLAKGNYDVRFNGRGFYEVVELCETLNTAAAELGRSENLRRELLANVSHDLRTPLALIYSYAEMMSDFPDEVTAEQTKTIMEEARRLTTLVNDALDLSKLENDIKQSQNLVKSERYNLTKSIFETASRMREMLLDKEYKFIFDYDREVFIKADCTKIERAFYNLLINAVNYSFDRKTITVSQKIVENHGKSFVRISVTDSGGGIPQSDLPYIWDRYYKSGKPHVRAVTGTGLGLSIVRKIIELHSGNYGVDSQVGEGSTFWFEIEV